MADFTKAIEHLKQAEACLERARLAMREAGMPQRSYRIAGVEGAILVVVAATEGLEFISERKHDTKA